MSLGENTENGGQGDSAEKRFVSIALLKGETEKRKKLTTLYEAQTQKNEQLRDEIESMQTQ
jgi:hypothetical protein